MQPWIGVDPHSFSLTCSYRNCDGGAPTNNTGSEPKKTSNDDCLEKYSPSATWTALVSVRLSITQTLIRMSLLVYARRELVLLKARKDGCYNASTKTKHL